MPAKRFLPEYVSRFRDRHGKWRYRFRRKGYPSAYINAEIGTEEFRTAYAAAMQAVPPPVGVERTAPGSIGDLYARYVAVPARLGPTPVTQQKVRRVLEKFRDEYRDNPVHLLDFEHIDLILATKREKRVVDGREEGGVHAARKLRKELVRMFAYAVRIKMLPINPVLDAERIKTAPSERSKGFYTWTEDDITAYRKRHPLGGQPRLAMEIMLWTGQRRSDARMFGPADIIDGRIRVEQAKTGKEGMISVSPQLVAAITAMPPPPEGATTFLLTKFGHPFSKAGFGNAMRRWCDQAGLPECTAHGLRKAIMRRMAELGMSNQTMKSVSFHSRDEEVALYTRAANQQRMADSAIDNLARWEVSNQPQTTCLTAPEVHEKVLEKQHGGSLSRIRTYGRSINSRELYR